MEFKVGDIVKYKKADGEYEISSVGDYITLKNVSTVGFYLDRFELVKMKDELKPGDNVKYIGETESYKGQRGTVKKAYIDDQGERVVDVKAHGYKNLDLKNIPAKDMQKDNSPPKPIRSDKRFILTIKKSETGLISWRA